MAAGERPDAAQVEERPRPARDEAARARAYLDLWERHLIAAAVDGPSSVGHRTPA